MKHMLKFTGICIALLVLSGCYFRLPNDKVLKYNFFSFSMYTILSNTATDFQWSFDGEVLPGKTTNSFLYLFLPKDVGIHTIRVDFTDKGEQHTEVWTVTVRGWFDIEDDIEEDVDEYTDEEGDDETITLEYEDL